ncbi:helix-turn-helix transcriptional regulator, partial [Aeromonas veronii]|nr:helix-turn-helix transcriptional regulator [Aeromonas veronii]
GYSSSVAFGRAFERELGMSPGRWLKAQQQAE